MHLSHSAYLWTQVVLAVILIGAILLQQNEAGLGAAYGGDTGAGMHTKRGAERVMFYITIVIAVLFAASAVGALFVQN